MTTTAAETTSFDAANWIRRARAANLYLQAMPGGLYRGCPGGDDPAEMRRAAAELDAEILDPEASRAVWTLILAQADQ